MKLQAAHELGDSEERCLLHCGPDGSSPHEYYARIKMEVGEQAQTPHGLTWCHPRASFLSASLR